MVDVSESRTHGLLSIWGSQFQHLKTETSAPDQRLQPLSKASRSRGGFTGNLGGGLFFTVTEGSPLLAWKPGVRRCFQLGRQNTNKHKLTQMCPQHTWGPWQSKCQDTRSWQPRESQFCLEIRQ